MSASFLAGLHAGFSAPRAAILALIERATDRRVETLDRVVRGYDNEVHRAGMTDDTAVFIRIRRPGESDSDYPSEVAAMRWARQAGVPVPDVLALERIATPAGDRDAMLVAQARGRQLAGLLPALTADERRRAMRGVGRTLALLHTVRTPGVWRPERDGTWSDAADIRRGFIAERTAERGHLKAAGLSAEEIDQTLGLLGASTETPASGVDPVLCHGDVMPEHVFVGPDLEVSDLIDWGMWHGGSAVGELAYTAMCHPKSDVEAIVAGHGRGDFGDPAFRRSIYLSVTNLVIGHIAHHVSIGDTANADYNVAVLRSALAELRGLARARHTD